MQTCRAFISETRRETLRRYAIVLRLQDRGSPFVASLFGWGKCHWRFSILGLTPVGSAPASLLATVSEINARHVLGYGRSLWGIVCHGFFQFTQQKAGFLLCSARPLTLRRPPVTQRLVLE